MCGNRDQTDLAMMIPARLMIGGNGQKACIFTLRTRIGLHRHRIIACDLAQIIRQGRQHLRIALGLILWRKRVQPAKFGPCDWHHLDRGVQLHRARAKRDHGTIQRQVTIRQAAHIPHHLGFRAVHVENRMGEILCFPQERVRDRWRFNRIQKRCAKRLTDRGQMGFGCHLIHGNTNPILANITQVDPPRHSRGHDPRLFGPDLDCDRVKIALRQRRKAARLKTFGETRCVQMHPLRNRAQSARAVEHRIKRGHDGQKRLRGADIRGGFLAANMLLARLQGEAIGTAPLRVNRYANKPTWDGPLIGLATGKKCCVRATISQRHTKALR